mgnify:CR=1 FL=1
MNFNILSDLHLELLGYIPVIKKTANNLILAGDIGDPSEDIYINFIEKCSKLYEKVFLIKGNHECYDKTVKETDEMINDICKKYNNIYYLNNSHIDIGDIRIIGCTLWSEISDENKSEISCYISDFNKIKKWCVELNNYQHYKDICFIDKHTKECIENKLKLIVITHHSPVLNSILDNYKGSDLNEAFQSDLSEMIKKPIKLWIYGHTHYSKYHVINDIPVVSNQFGYEEEDSEYHDKFIFILS